MKYFLGLILILLFATASEAAICYVRDGGTATGSSGRDTNGGSWNTANAYDQLSTAETNCPRGDTIYVADGTYSSVVFNTAASGTTLITIKKATESDHGTSTGWLSAYGDGTATIGPIDFVTSYWVFDGIFGGGPGSWNGAFGFEIDHTGTQGAGITFAGGSNITIRHVKTIGNFGSSDSNSDSFSCSGTANNITVSYFWAFHAGRTIIFCPQTSNNVLFEYGLFDAIQGFGQVHGETASIWGNPSNWTVRYSLVTGIDSTGGFMWDNHVTPSGSFWFYGNVVYDIGEAWGTHGNGVIGGWQGGGGEQTHNIKVYNNTFITVSNGTPALGSLANIRSGLEARNNLFYQVDNVSGSIWTVSHNHYISSQVVGTNTSTGSGNPFVDFVNFDFRLTAGTTAGTDLGAPFNVDMLGNTRSTWTRGALEFVTGGGDTEAPTQPTDLALQVISTTQIDLTWTASTDNVGVTGYKIYRCSGASCTPTAEIDTDTASPYSSTGLSASTLYGYAVSAFDAAANESIKSATQYATTNDPPGVGAASVRGRMKGFR